MTVKTHCDNHNCGVSRGESVYMTSAGGDIVYGWWEVHRADRVWHFHDIHCLERWSFDEAAKHQLKSDVER